MCAKPEPFNYLQPIAVLHEEMTHQETNVLPQLSWAGVQVFYGILENI